MNPLPYPPFCLRQLTICLLLPLTTSAFALEDTTLPTVMVTATQREQAIQDVQASVQVVSRRELAATPGLSLLDGLDQAVGVDTRGSTLNSSVTMRGMTSSGTLVLFDGLRRPQKYGSRDINLFSSEQVEQIEIVRGPMSALYGADASGGVINVISRMPQLNSGLHGNLSTLFGQSQGKQRETDLWKAGVEYGGEQFTHRLSIEQRNREPYRRDTGVERADLKGVDESYLTYRGGWQLAPDQRLRASFEHVEQNDRGPDQLSSAPFTTFTGYERETRNFGSIGYSGTLGVGQLHLDLAQGRTDAKTSRAFPTIEETAYTQTQLAGRYLLPLGKQLLTIGAGQTLDRLSIANNTSQVGNRSNDYLFVQGEFELAPQWSLLTALRHDAFNEFGRANTPRLSLQYRPGNWTFRAGYGEAFRAPTVLEQYSTFRRGTFLILGNSALVPEESRSFEAAAAYQGRDYRIDLAAYQTHSKNLITTVNSPRLASDPVGVISRATYTNIGQARIEGAELSGEWRINSQWSTRGAFEYLSAHDETTGQRLLGRATHIARANLRYESGAWSTDLQGRYYFNYYNSHNSIRGYNLYTNYGTTDLKLSYRIDRQLTVAGGVSNLFASKAPSNWGSMYSLEDPPTRFFYLSANYRF